MNMIELVLGILTGIILLNFLLERWLSFINMRHTLPELPLELEGIYDEEKYRKSQMYKKENVRFGMWSSTFECSRVPESCSSSANVCLRR